MSDEKIFFKYLFDDKYQPKYINGVYGGVNPSGELIAHFYFERFPLPYESAIEIDDQGNMSDEDIVINPAEYKYLRDVRSGIVMDKDVACTLYQWLGNNLKEMGVNIDELSDDNENG